MSRFTADDEFAFEVPTPAGLIRIVSPIYLRQREAIKAAAIIRRVLKGGVIAPLPPFKGTPDDR